MTPLKMTLVASPRIFGTEDREEDADHGQADDQNDERCLGAEPAEEASEGGTEFFDFSPVPIPMPIIPGPRRGPGPPVPGRPIPGGGPLGAPPAPPAGRGPLMRLPPRRTAASRRSRDTSRSTREAPCECRCPRSGPASMTRIRSAPMIVPTRWATMTIVAHPSSRASVARRRASVA